MNTILDYFKVPSWYLLVGAGRRKKCLVTVACVRVEIRSTSFNYYTTAFESLVRVYIRRHNERDIELPEL
jgi:hypothetical protein